MENKSQKRLHPIRGSRILSDQRPVPSPRPRLIRYPDRMGTVVRRRFAEEEDKSGGESGTIDIERRALERQKVLEIWRNGCSRARSSFPPPSKLYSALEGAMNGSFYEPRLVPLQTSSRNTGRTLFLFHLSPFHSPSHRHPSAPQHCAAARERERTCRFSFSPRFGKIDSSHPRIFAPGIARYSDSSDEYASARSPKN